MAFEDFTTYTEDDISGVLTVAANAITFTNLMAGSDYNQVIKDAGVSAYPGNFRFRGKATISTAANAGASVRILDFDAQNPGAVGQIGSPSIKLSWQKGGGANPVFYVEVWDSGNTTDTASQTQSYTGAAVAIGTSFYWDLERSSTALTCKIYSDSGYSTLVTTLSLTVTVATYRYIIPVATWYLGTANTISGVSENLESISSSISFVPQRTFNMNLLSF